MITLVHHKHKILPRLLIFRKDFVSEVMQNSFIKRISEKVITVIPMNGEGDILLWFFKVKSETAGVIRDNRQPKSLNFLEITDLRDCRV